MESLYWVINHACHRKCRHCYDDRFRPYVRDALEKKVRESETAFQKIIQNLPAKIGYTDDAGDRQRGRIILAGGEVLVDPVRERVLYPIIDALNDKYGGEANIIVQTTGDLVTESILDELLKRGVWMISVAGMDDYHVGHEGEKRLPLIEKLHMLFKSRGMGEMNDDGPVRRSGETPTAWYHMFGASEDAWIGKLWPRGRAWQNGLTTASLDDNFCNAWSGGLKFLDIGKAGSEVSIEPDGSVYPCCLKTAAPLGNLTEESLTSMLESLASEPALRAINSGDPAAMGETYGLSRDQFVTKSTATMPTGASCSNFCIGCDAFFRETMEPILARLRAERLGAKTLEAQP